MSADPAGGFRVRGLGATGAGRRRRRDGDGPAMPTGPARQPWRRRGEVITADAVILAVPAGPRPGWPPAAGVTDAARWEDLGTSPIVNVHVVYDRRVTRLPFAAAVDSPVQWVFDKTGHVGAAGRAVPGRLAVRGGRLRGRRRPRRCASSSCPRWRSCSRRRADARVTDFFVTRERRATFRQAPGCGALRPGAATSRAGPGAGRRLDRYRMAGHDGGCRAERTHCSARADPRAGHLGRPRTGRRRNARGRPGRGSPGPVSGGIGPS